MGRVEINYKDLKKMKVKLFFSLSGMNACYKDLDQFFGLNKRCIDVSDLFNQRNLFNKL